MKQENFMIQFSATECVSPQDLNAYHAGTLNAERKHLVEDHLLDCELCSKAVDGFALIPAGLMDVNGLNKQIDHSAHLTNTSSGNFFLNILLGIFIAVGLFAVCSSLSHQPEKIISPSVTEQSVTVAENVPVTDNPAETQASVIAEEIKQVHKTYPNDNFIAKKTVAEPLPERLTPNSVKQLSSSAATGNEDIRLNNFPADIIYINDFKISGYKKYYFKKGILETRNMTLASSENKPGQTPEISGAGQRTSADKILRSALSGFSQGRYGETINEFDLLLEENPKDVNAQFYSALAFYQLHKPAKAIALFNTVLQNENTDFNPEAQWYKSLSLWESGQKDEAIKLLKEIVESKGFYKERATEKLKGLQ